MIAGDERAARRLARAADEIGREELRQGSLQLRFGIGFSVRREKKTGLVGFAFKSAGKGRSVVQKKMPIALFMQRHRFSALNQPLKVGLSAVLSAGCVWNKTQENESDA